MSTWRTILNNDGWFHTYSDPYPTDREDLNRKIDPLAEAGVDTFVLGMFTGNAFLHDTKVGELCGVEPGDRPPYWHADSLRNVRNLIAQGLDPMRVLCERAHERGMRFLAGLRMNDLHDILESKWNKWKWEHPDMLIGTKGRLPKRAEDDIDWDPGWGSWGLQERLRQAALNYADPRVVKHRLAILGETIERYEIDGLELDFLRHPIFFPPGEEAQHAHILTELVRQIRKLLDNKSRHLELGAIVPYSPQVCKDVGMEIDKWIAESMLDYVAPRPGDLFVTELPLEGWKNLLTGSRTQLLGAAFELDNGIEDDVFYALASRCRQVGADGMHLFNFNYHHPYGARETSALLKGLHDPDTTARHDKHYILASRRHRVVSYTERFDTPCRLKDEAQIAFFLGDDLAARPNQPAPRSITIQLYTRGFTPSADEIAFTVNGHDIASTRIRQHEETVDVLKVGYWWTKPQRMLVTDLDVTGMSLRVGENRFVAKLIKRRPGAQGHVVIRHFGLYVRYPCGNPSRQGTPRRRTSHE